MKNNIIPKLLMSLGALVYLLGIWRTCPLFSGKGYFLGVLDEKIIYVAAWFVCLYGVSAMPHKALAAQAAQKDSSERP